jgi:hypothetical protein
VDARIPGALVEGLYISRILQNNFQHIGLLSLPAGFSASSPEENRS